MSRLRRAATAMLGGALWGVLPAHAWAQVQAPPPGAPRPPTVAADTTAPGTACVFPALPDTGRAPQLVVWPAADSVLQALLERQQYVATRYCADSVAFDPQTGTLRLLGDAAIEREGVILVGDSVIYNDSTRMLVAFAAENEQVRLRDPAQVDDLIAGWIEYDLATRVGRVRDVRTSVESGEQWYLWAHTAAAQLPDSATGQQTAFFGVDGTLTSCNLREPHYHFQARQLKMISKNIMVVRPAVLYIADIPVMWLPFVFQDMRSGRRSGILSPRLGFSDIVRNSPTYRRQVENIGYYFAISDYMDATAWLDWRSGARGSDEDPGWKRLNGELRYRWLDRFLEGRIGANHDRLQSGVRSTNLSWQHSQRFSMSSSLMANLNYSTNTSVRRQTEFLPSAVLATINSQVNYQQQLGPAAVNLGGSRTQFTGRDEVRTSFPTLTVSTGPIDVADWLTWTPDLNVSNAQVSDVTASGPLAFRYSPNGSGGLDSVRLGWDSRQTTVSFNTPLEILGFRWRNSFRVRDEHRDYAQFIVVQDVADSATKTTRVFSQTYETSIDWETGISLPSLSPGRWNLSPNLSIVNVDAGHGFWVRNHLTGGNFVRQSKRLRYGVSASPTFFGLWPGIGAFARFRHKLSPSLSWSYAPAADVSDEFLRALNQSRQRYLGALPQNQISAGLNQTIEARLRAPVDSAPESGEKLSLLSITASSVTFDFERLREVRRRAAESGLPEPGLSAGFASDAFSYSLRSELLPGIDVRVDYSLFSGDRNSDTAKFEPYRTGISANVSFDHRTNPIVVLTRIFGKAAPPTGSAPEAATVGEPTDSTFARQVAAMPLAGENRTPSLMVPQTEGWRASFTFTSARQRPPTPGSSVIEYSPELQCEFLRDDSPVVYELCLEQARNNPVVPDTLNQTPGGAFYRVPPTTTLLANLGLNVTPKWAMQWNTTYDFRRKSFASHTVSLQRELHDWRAIFAFTQAPNGNFAFNFFIALKAEPDLKFDYNSRTYRNAAR